MKGFYKVTIRSLRTGLEFWTVVEAANENEAESKGYKMVRAKKGGWWPTPDKCRMVAKFLGKEQPELTESGELVEVPASDQDPEC